MQNAYSYVKRNKNANELGTFLDKAKDWYIQGMQLNNVYLEDWNEIKSVFSKLGLNLNTHGPILTINEVKNVRLAQKLSENPRGYAQKDVFLATLASLPIYCRHLGAQKFDKWMNTKDFTQIMDLRGTMKDKDKEMEQIIEPIFLGKKKDLKI